MFKKVTNRLNEKIFLGICYEYMLSCFNKKKKIEK